jgi:hypothetical protein
MFTSCSEFVTFSKLPKIDAANKAVTTTKWSKVQKSHKPSASHSGIRPAMELPHASQNRGFEWATRVEDLGVAGG